MTVWPSIAAYETGQFLGRLYEIRWPDVYFFRIGRLVALLSIATLVPVALYFYRLLPRVGASYSLTTRRIVEVPLIQDEGAGVARRYTGREYVIGSVSGQQQQR